MTDTFWLSEKLKQKTKEVFEPRYGRKLTDSEVIEIADNLEVVVEEILKLKWRQKYGDEISRP